jgi:hypothetical protein
VGVPGGLYNDNRDEDFKLGSVSRFDPAKPYLWLYAGADRALNLSYRTLLAARSGKQADNLRIEQRAWIQARDTSCNEALEGEEQRCQWVATYNRFAGTARPRYPGARTMITRQGMTGRQAETSRNAVNHKGIVEWISVFALRSPA